MEQYTTTGLGNGLRRCGKIQRGKRSFLAKSAHPSSPCVCKYLVAIGDGRSAISCEAHRSHQFVITLSA